MPRNMALIVTDMLNDFVHGALKCERAATLVPVLQSLLAGARRAEIPIIYSNDAHLPVDVEIGVWGEHAMAGTADAFFRGFKVAMVTDATNAFTAEDRAHGLDYIEKIYGAELVTSEQLLAAWEEASE